MSKRDDFLLIGHRGLPQQAQENSATTFKKAVALSIPMVEIDVRLTKDKKLVVIHNSDIKSVSNSKGKVHEHTYKYLSQFNYGYSFNEEHYEKLLLLEEALSILLPEVQVMVELKQHKKTYKDMAVELVKVLEQFEQFSSQIVVCSFCLPLLLKIQNLNKSLSLGFIFRNKPKKSLNLALQHGFHSIHPHHRIMKKNFVDIIHSYGMKVYIWTINSFKSAQKWKEMKVDGIITDMPEKIREILHKP